jgi:hypothetical protein
MMKSFCTAANLWSLVKNNRCPDIIQTFALILEECYHLDHCGTLMDDIRTLDCNLHNDITKLWIYDPKQFQPLETHLHKALAAYTKSHLQGWVPGSDALLHVHHTIQGIQYAEVKARGKNNRSRNSVVYFQPLSGGPLVPGLVQKIFSIPWANQDGIMMKSVFIAVWRY